MTEACAYEMLGQVIATLKKTEREEKMTNPRKLIGTLAVAGGMAVTMLALSGGVQAAEIKRTPSLETLLKAAQAEGPLNVIWGNSLGAAAGAKSFQDAINKTYGVNIKVTYTPGPSMPRMASRLIQEFKAGREASTDLFIGVEVNLPGMIKAGGATLDPVVRPFPAHHARDAGEERLRRPYHHAVQRHPLQHTIHQTA